MDSKRNEDGGASDVFSDSEDKAKAIEIKAARDGDTHCAHNDTQPRGTKEDVDGEEENVELLMPRSFELRDSGSGVVCEVGAATVDPFYVVDLLSVCLGVCGCVCS